MDRTHRETIRGRYLDLSRYLSASISDIVRGLWQARIISEYMRDDVLRHHTDSEKARALLDLITKRGANAYDALYRCVLEAEIYPAADILMPEKGPHFDIATGITPSQDRVRQSGAGPEITIPSHQSDGPVPSDLIIPDRWPSEDHVNKEIEVINVSVDSPVYKEYRESLKPFGQQFYYTMHRKVRGRVLVINNEKFTEQNNLDPFLYKSLNNRDGTSRDRDGLMSLFTQLKFSVEIQDDKTKEEMSRLLDMESQLDHSHFDCFVLIILSHGCKKGVFGVDGHYINEKTDGNVQFEPKNFLPIQDIKNKFCNTKSLMGKPKLFFIQACRGEQKLEGVNVSDNANNAKASNDDPHVSTQDENIRDLQQLFKDFNEGQTVSDAGGESLPLHADYFMALATTSGVVSWRNDKLGSWFIQAIIYIFSNYAHQYDLLKLMTLANHLICKAETKQGYKQVAEKMDTLQKTFFFFPGLSD